MQNSSISELVKGYEGKEMPLPEYAGLVAVFGTLFAGLVLTSLATRRNDDKLRDLLDVALIGIATHKLSRMAAKDKVTSPFRAPVARFVEKGSPGEVEEESRGTGMQKAIGDLATCPYCLSPWIAAILGFGLLRAPTTTRFVCGLFSSVAISHFLHQSYSVLDDAREKVIAHDQRPQTSGHCHHWSVSGRGSRHRADVRKNRRCSHRPNCAWQRGS